jgi:hypothetical protein
MKIMSLREGEQWLAKRGKGYLMTEKSWPFVKRDTYRIPSDSGRKTSLARILTSALDEKLEGLLWVRDWSAFPSSANLDLFYGYRNYLGDKRLLVDAPCHVFSKGDMDSVQSLVCMSLYFYWDTVLLASDRDVVVTTTNDEFMDLYSDNEQDHEELASKLELFGLHAK